MSSITMLPLATTQQEGLNMQHKQDRLVSGINIKTINKQNILGSGNLDIQSSGDFTELLTEVSQTYATKKFVEDALAEIPSGESSMFEATFGETPFADLWNAYQSNKHVVVRDGKFVLSLVRADETLISFSAINNENVYSATCNSSNKWQQGAVFQAEKATNKVTSLSDKSTNTQYPSAKAVYDAIQQSGVGGNSHWVLRETHTFDGVNGTITISDLPMEFLALLDYNGTIDKAKKVTFQVGQPELMRAAYDFAASRQMHIGFHLTSDGVITNIVSCFSEWNNTEATTPKIVYNSIVLPQAFKLFVYGNSIIPEGTTIKIYTR